ncbi:glycoside hydrolase [Reichenbachiella ulvae]|uniref:Xylanase n=1 Tax=Reichenbachiella ulvae TaxID=2980104 RepID=A0ABT3CW04_9BACT|nr:glycoside hydrolase [Reichenbachiella ulvae]MCV9387896.1 xylanase [Reichenbachiella ulvae]
MSRWRQDMGIIRCIIIICLFIGMTSCESPEESIACVETDPCDCPQASKEDCQEKEGEEPNEEVDKEEVDYLTLSLDLDKTFQQIKSFGASDAWSIQFVGKNWNENSREKIAELLFSTEFDESNDPKGIGLSTWRFNIGAGSAEQGANSNINDEWRRAEGFLNADGSYDWNKQEGQQWFLERALSYGVDDFTAFLNSPPVSLTRNGMAYSEDGVSANLDEANFDKYADFIVEVLQNMQSKVGVHFDHVSPFNEPQWEWKCCNQEGSPWNNEEMAAMTRVLDEKISTAQIDTKIEVTEAGSLDFLYSNERDSRRNDQIYNFFSPTRDTYIGDLDNVAMSIAGHSYFTTYDLSTLLNTRKLVNDKINEINPELDFIMSEYCILEDHEEIKGSGRDLGMDPALYLARVIHSDLVYANAVSWQWWLAVSPYDYKDGLIYIDHNTVAGNVYESKMLWSLGNYSRFIRPGMTRISLERSDKLSDIAAIEEMLPSAYKSEDEVVIVLVNQTEEAEKVVIEGLSDGYSSIDLFQTSETKSLDHVRTYQDVNSEIIIAARSIVTLVIK